MTKPPARKPAKPKMATLLVPMLAENWALCLASGFIGGKPRPDCGEDVQALFPDGIVGCRSKVAPWMLAHGELGVRVVLKVAVPADGLRDEQDFTVAAGLFRVTLVKECQFASEEEKVGFEATFGAFPDVPARLVPLAVNKMPAAKGLALGFAGDVPASDGLATEREAMDTACGWVAGLARLFSQPVLDDVQSALGSDADAGIAELAAQALEALAPQSADVDTAIWSAVVAQKFAPRSVRIGDRHGLLEAVREALSKSAPGSADAQAWLSKVSDIISAKCDLPPLSDDGAIGRRAALAVILDDASGGLPLGPRVGALAALVSCASTGFKRLGAQGLKDDPARLDALLSLAGRIVSGEASQVAVVAGGPGPDFSAEDCLQSNGQVIARRTRPPPPWVAPLQDAARAAGWHIEPGPGTGLPAIAIADGDFRRYVVFEGHAGRGGDGVRAWTALAAVKPKAPGLPQVKAMLEAAWETGVKVGIRNGPGGPAICIQASVPADPFNAVEALAAAESIAATASLFPTG